MRTFVHELTLLTGPRRGGCPLLLLMAWLSAALSLGFHTPAAHAQVNTAYCYTTGSTYLDFGAIDLFGGNTDNSLVISYTCAAGVSQYPGTGTAYIKMCLDLGSGSGGSTLSPRTMSSIVGDGLALQYNFYSDAARSIVIGNETSGSYPPVSVNLQVPVSNFYTTTSGTLILYTRVPSGQGALISSPGDYYQSVFPGSASSLTYAWSSTGMPASCTVGTGGTGNQNLNIQVQAHIQSGCFISTATDLDFGIHTANLTANVDQTSMLAVTCTSNSSWQLGLNSGLHATGSTRQMIGPSGTLIQYGLYRDAARTQSWGNTLSVNTLNGSGGSATSLKVYGRVPPQSAVPAGAYSDTVTVTLTY